MKINLTAPFKETGSWPPSIVEVEWRDSIFLARWESPENRIREVDSVGDMVHRSVGYLLKICPQYIAISLSIGMGTKNVGDTLQIPAETIIRWRAHGKPWGENLWGENLKETGSEKEARPKAHRAQGAAKAAPRTEVAS